MGIENFSDLQVAEWSPSQKCFHIHSVEEMVKYNQRIFLENLQADYFPIGIFKTQEALNQFLREAHEYQERLSG